MTKKEFESWKEETARSANKWQLDLIHCTMKDALFFKGGENGDYLWIKNNKVTIGKYFHAIPHIGEAIFTQQTIVVCKDNYDAWKRLEKSGGMDFLLDLFSRF